MEGIEKLQSAIENIDSETNFSILSEMKVILNKAFGEENNQIIKPTPESIAQSLIENGHKIHLENGLKREDCAGYIKGYAPHVFGYRVLIRFPDITITNGKNKHDIKDLFVQFYVKPQGTIYPSISGIRTSLTRSEFQSGYFHSHLPSFSSRNIIFSHFCTGIGEINQIMSILSNRFSTANFVMFTMHIKNFVVWESREGRPYMYIADIFRRNRTIPALTDAVAQNAATIMLEHMKSIPVDTLIKMLKYSVSERKIKIESTEELGLWGAQHILSWRERGIMSSYIPEMFLCRKDESGNYHQIPYEETSTYPKDVKVLVFKGEEIIFKIIDKPEELEKESEEKKYANPKVTDYICKELSLQLTRIALIDSGIRTGNSITHQSRPSETSVISV